MKIVGISACPAGLAHTPMAAKALEKAGAKMGYDVKIEQQGSLGQINKISTEEAKEADFYCWQPIKRWRGWNDLKENRSYA